MKQNIEHIQIVILFLYSKDLSKARAKSTLSGVKISVPPGGLAKGANVTLAGNYKVYQNRVLLPHGETLVKQEVSTERNTELEASTPCGVWSVVMFCFLTEVLVKNWAAQ